MYNIVVYIPIFIIATGTKKTFEWLDIWEDQVNKNMIKEEEYLTESTAEGLFVTIQSTLEMSKYLLEHCGYKYILTCKFN